MELFAFILVILSTFTHAIWNLALKRVQGGMIFVWIFTTITCIIYLPVIVFNFKQIYSTLSLNSILFCTLSVVLHLLYYIFLDKAYFYGDLSSIYPITRGISPVFTIFFASLLMGEHINSFQLISISMIILGSFVLSGVGVEKIEYNTQSLIFALLCAGAISGYTLTDKLVMSQTAVSPFFLDFFNNLGRSALLAPTALRDFKKTQLLAKNHIKSALIVALLSPISYLMILFAMKHLDISIIAPLRQFSIVIGSLFGFYILNEKAYLYKKVGIAMTFLGVLMIYIF